MNIAFGWGSQDTLAIMSAVIKQESRAQTETVLKADLVGLLQEKTQYRIEYVRDWISKHDVDSGTLEWMLEKYSLATLRAVLSDQLKPDKDMVDWLATIADAGRCIAPYSVADEADVKAAPAELLHRLVRQLYRRCNPAHGKATVLCYSILRHSKLKTEINYVKEVAHMKYIHVQKTSSPGGKLYRIAAKYPDMF